MSYTDKERMEDFQWFLSQYDSLFQRYGHKYFVIQNQKILGVYNDHSQAVKSTMKDYTIGSFIVQECNGDESGYTNYIASNEVRVI